VQFSRLFCFIIYEVIYFTFLPLCLDCCDGSDEYDGKAKCPNTCWEAGKAAREKLRKKIATYQEGVKVRKQAIEHAHLALEKDEAELSKLKKEESILKGVVKQLKGTIFLFYPFLVMMYLRMYELP